MTKVARSRNTEKESNMATLREQVEELKKQNAELEKMYKKDVKQVTRERDEAREKVRALEELLAEKQPAVEASVLRGMRHV